MSTGEVVDALHGWVERIAGLGAAVVPRLRPGLPAERIAAISATYGFALTDEIAAVWAWHDGEKQDADARIPGLPGLTPGVDFFDLDTTLRVGLSRWYDLCGDEEGLHDPELSEDERGGIWHRDWVVFGWGHLPLVLATGPDGSTDTFRFDPQSGTAWVAHSSLAERVAQWHRYLDLGAWRVEPDGTWGVDADRLPRVDQSATAAEQAGHTEVT